MNPFLTLTESDHHGSIEPDESLRAAVAADQQGRIAEDVALDLACIQLDAMRAWCDGVRRNETGGA